MCSGVLVVYVFRVFRWSMCLGVWGLGGLCVLGFRWSVCLGFRWSMCLGVWGSGGLCV